MRYTAADKTNQMLKGFVCFLYIFLIYNVVAEVFVEEGLDLSQEIADDNDDVDNIEAQARLEPTDDDTLENVEPTATTATILQESDTHEDYIEDVLPTEVFQDVFSTESIEPETATIQEADEIDFNLAQLKAESELEDEAIHQDVGEALSESDEVEQTQQIIRSSQAFQHYKTAVEFIEESNNVQEGLKNLRTAADLGSAQALYLLGEFHLFGNHVSQDFGIAARYFNASAALGLSQAQRMFAFMLETGRGVEKNSAKALLYYEFAALNGDLEAHAVLGNKYYYGDSVRPSCIRASNYYRKAAEADIERYTTTKLETVSPPQRIEDASGEEEEDIVQYYQYAADTGDSLAQQTVGALYLHGIYGLPRDFSAALRLFSLAAEQNEPEAFAHLGFLYMMGYGVEQSYDTAISYFNKAIPKSQLANAYLGELYLKGLGVPQNVPEAIRLFTQAAAAKEPLALMHLGTCHFKGLGVKRDINKALTYYAEASRGRNIVAMYNLGQMYKMGGSVVRSCANAVMQYKRVVENGAFATFTTDAYRHFEAGDIENALIIYERAALMGFELAQSNAAYLYEKYTEETYHSGAMALTYYRMAAEQQNAKAHLKIGDYHYYGRGTERDVSKAAAFYRLASDMREAQATFNLGYMHQYGIGLPQDFYLAKRYYDTTTEYLPSARLPSTLALIGLGAHYLWSEYEFQMPPYSEWELDTIVILLLAVLFVIVGMFRLRLLVRP